MKRLTLFAFMLIVMTTLNSCKEKPTSTENPFFTTWDTPFGVPPFDEIKNEHYKPAIEEGIKRHAAEIDSLVALSDAPTFANVIEAMDRSGALLTNAYTVFSLVNSADSNDTLQQIDMEVSPLVSSHFDNVYLNDRLFAKVKAVYDARESSNLDPQQLRLTEKTYKQFVRAGALLSPEKKEQLRKVNDQLSAIGVKFGNNLLSENKDFVLVIDKQEELKGLPETVVAAAAAEAEQRGENGKWVFTLSKPSLIPFITYAENRDLRQQLYEGYLNRGNNNNACDNKALVQEFAKLRIEKANLMGYPTYAAFGLDNVMAKTPENVFNLLNKLWTPALGLAKNELAEMKAIKLTETGNDDFASWDWWYYAEKVRKAKYDLDEEMLRPYFPLANVTSGIFQLCNRLYGITFRPISAPVYNKECSVYEVLDKDNSHLGVLYLDFHPRDGKRGGAWCGGYREQRYENGERIAPVVTIVCNFTRPNGSTPALLNLDETETYFHEFGHALHALFSNVQYTGVSGVERDFVELPSQIMENWAFEPEMLKKYANHYQNGAAIPDHLIAKIQNSSLFNQGFTTTELLAASLSDLEIHNLTSAEGLDPIAFEKKVLNEKRGLIPEIAPRYRYPYFSHIFDGGYSAGYYSYIWAEVLDKDAYEAFVESGDIFNPKVADAFRKNILEQGGTSDGMVLYENFRGKQPDITPLMKKRGLL